MTVRHLVITAKTERVSSASRAGGQSSFKGQAETICLVTCVALSRSDRLC